MMVTMLGIRRLRLGMLLLSRKRQFSRAYLRHA